MPSAAAALLNALADGLELDEAEDPVLEGLVEVPDGVVVTPNEDDVGKAVGLTVGAVGGRPEDVTVELRVEVAGPIENSPLVAYTMFTSEMLTKAIV